MHILVTKMWYGCRVETMQFHLLTLAPQSRPQWVEKQIQGQTPVQYYSPYMTLCSYDECGRFLLLQKVLYIFTHNQSKVELHNMITFLPKPKKNLVVVHYCHTLHSLYTHTHTHTQHTHTTHTHNATFKLNTYM